MDVRAAVAHKAGAPLTIETVQLEGPRAGEVLVEIKATGICHTDEFTLSGADPEGLFPAILGHEGAGVVVDVGPGVTTREEGRSRHPALHARVPAVRVLPEPQDQSVPGDPRDAGPGPDAGRHQPLLDRRQEAPPLHGHVDLRELHGAAGDRGREDPRGRAVRQGLLHRLRRHDRHRRGDQHGEGGAGRQRRRVRPRRHRPQRGAGRAHGRRQHDRRRRPQPGAQGPRREVRDDAFRQPEGGRGRPRALPRRPHQGRRRLQLRMHRQREDDAAGARVLPQGLGRQRHHRRRRRRPGDLDAAVPARHRTGLEGHRVRRRAGPHRRAEDRRLVHGRQDQHRRSDHAHDAARGHQQGAST